MFSANPPSAGWVRLETSPIRTFQRTPGDELRALRSAIRQVLEHRFGTLPVHVQARLEIQDSAETLRACHRHAFFVRAPHELDL